MKSGFVDLPVMETGSSFRVIQEYREVKRRGKRGRNPDLTAFFFADGWASKGFWKQAESLVHWWPQIVLKARAGDTGNRLFDALERKRL